jgi:hypothetical protein
VSSQSSLPWRVSGLAVSFMYTPIALIIPLLYTPTCYDLSALKQHTGSLATCTAPRSLVACIVHLLRQTLVQARLKGQSFAPGQHPYSVSLRACYATLLSRADCAFGRMLHLRAHVVPSGAYCREETAGSTTAKILTVKALRWLG